MTFAFVIIAAIYLVIASFTALNPVLEAERPLLAVNDLAVIVLVSVAARRIAARGLDAFRQLIDGVRRRGRDARDHGNMSAAEANLFRKAGVSARFPALLPSSAWARPRSRGSPRPPESGSRSSAWPTWLPGYGS